MILTKENILKLHRKYAKNERHFNIIVKHCEIVNDVAQWVTKNIDTDVDTELLEQACLIHDIASSAFMSDHDFDHRYYQMHAILGGKLLIDEGVDPRIAEMVSNHLSISVTKEEVERYGLKIPARDHMPTSIEGRILNYADEFHSKDPKFNSVESKKMYYTKFMPSQLSKFIECMEEFGVPDLDILSDKYGCPIV